MESAAVTVWPDGWELPSAAPPPPRRGQVHCWLGPIPGGPVLSELNRFLDSGERARAEAMRAASTRNEWMAARVGLRLRAARYLGLPPREIVVSREGHGKPRLVPDALRHNLSHGGGWILWAFTARGELGVDLEAWRNNLRIGDVARRFFHPGEAEALRALPECERRAAFLDLWTRKEACLKCQGLGLHGRLDQFRFAWRPGGWLAVEQCDTHLRPLPAPAQCAAVLASDFPPESVRCWRLDWETLIASY